MRRFLMVGASALSIVVALHASVQADGISPGSLRADIDAIKAQIGASGAGGGSAVSALAVAVPFATTIPLDGIRYMPRTAVTGPLAFSAGTTKPGGTLSVSLISNGSNAPTFSGMVEDSSSQGWLSTQYTVNVVTFWADDTTVYYSVRQAATPQTVIPAATAYTLTGPASATVGAASTYTVTAGGSLASAVTVTPNDGGVGGTFSPATVTLAAGNSTSATFTYTPKATGTVSLSATNNGGLTNPAALSVTVAAAVSVTYLRLTGLTGLTEAVDGSVSSAYDYTANTTSGLSSGYAVSAVGIPASADGYVGYKVNSASVSGALVGLSASSSSVSYSSFTYGIYAINSDKAYYQVLNNGAGGGAPDTQVTIAANDTMRMRRSGSTIVGEVSKDNGSTWTTVKTWTGASAAKLYGNFQASTQNAVVTQPFSSTNAQ